MSGEGWDAETVAVDREREPMPERSERRRPPLPRPPRRLAGIGVVLLLVLAAFVAGRSDSQGPDPAPRASVAPTRHVAAPRPQRVHRRPEKPKKAPTKRRANAVLEGGHEPQASAPTPEPAPVEVSPEVSPEPVAEPAPEPEPVEAAAPAPATPAPPAGPSPAATEFGIEHP